MEHDISKLHPIHQKLYKDFVTSQYVPNEVPDKLYLVFLELSKIPKKDWGKQSTKDRLRDL